MNIKKYIPLVLQIFLVGSIFISSYLGIYKREVASNENGVIIVIKNTSIDYDFSNQVWEGIVRSERIFLNKLKNQPEIVEFDMKYYDAENPYSQSNIFDDFIKLLSQNKVLGVISGGTSLTDKTIINVCKKLRIPLILCVSTNDKLLDKSTEGVVFRLPPNNSKQAEEIIKYCHNYTRISLLYENNVYGVFLYEKLSKIFKQENKNFYSLEVNRTNDFFDIIPNIDSLKTDLIIYLGYFTKSYDLIKKLDGFNKNVPLLLSDGCYSGLLNDLSKSVKFKIALSFPSQLSDITQLQQGFENYGYDAYLLLSNLHTYWSKHRSQNLKECLENISKSYNSDDKTMLEYGFNKIGESSNHNYNIIELGK